MIDPDGTGLHDVQLDFFRLFGNVTGNGTVSNADLTAITAAFGQSGPLLNSDVNGDGNVNALDRTLATQAVGHHLGSGLHLDD